MQKLDTDASEQPPHGGIAVPNECAQAFAKPHQHCGEYERRGMDPWIGRRLPGLAHAAGLEPREARLLDFGACHGMPRFPTVIQNLLGVVASAGPDLVASSAITEGELTLAIDELRAWSARRDAALWYAVPWLAAERPR